MEVVEFELFINYIRNNKDHINIDILKNEFSTLINKYDLDEDLNLIIQIIEIDDSISTESLIEIILNLKGKYVKNFLLESDVKKFEYISRFIGYNFDIEFLPKTVTIYNSNINNQFSYKNDLNKSCIINLKETNNELINLNNNNIIEINKHDNGYYLNGNINIYSDDNFFFYDNIDVNYFGDVKLTFNKTSLYFDLKNDEVIKEIVTNFKLEFNKYYKKNFENLIYQSKYFLNIDFINSFIKEFISQNKEYNRKNKINPYILSTSIKMKSSPIINRCDHINKLNLFIKDKKPNQDILNDFLNDQIIIKDSLIFCKWCFEKIEFLNFDELEENKIILVNYELFRTEPYVNYINFKQYLENFLYNFLSVFEIDFYDYISILAISILNWLTYLSLDRLKYENEYINDINNNYIFFSRLTQDIFSFNLRENILFFNKRFLFTNLYLIFLLFLELSINDFWFFFLKHNKKNKNYKELILSMFTIYIKKINIKIEDNIDIKVFLSRFYDIIIDIIPESIETKYKKRIYEYDIILEDSINQISKNYNKNSIIKKSHPIEDILYDINIYHSNFFLYVNRYKKKSIMNQKVFEKDKTEYIYLKDNNSFYNDKNFLKIKNYYDNLTFYYKYKNENYQIEVEKIDSEYCIYEKSNNEKKLFIMFKNIKDLNLTYKTTNNLSDLFIFLNINNKLIFLKKYTFEESKFIINTFLFNIELIIDKKIIINDIKYPIKLDDMLNLEFNILTELTNLKLLDLNNLDDHILKLNNIFNKNE